MEDLSVESLINNAGTVAPLYRRVLAAVPKLAAVAMNSTLGLAAGCPAGCNLAFTMVALVLAWCSRSLFAMPSSTAKLYLPLLTRGVMIAAPLVPVCSSSWRGFAFTMIFCSTPCCLVPPALGLVASNLLPAFGMPANMLHPSLVQPAWLGLLFAVLALWFGPMGAAAHVETAAVAAILLATLRIIWSCVRICLLMPSLLTSCKGPATPIDRKLSEVPPGGSCVVLACGLRFTVRRLRLARGVDALAFEHPSRADKWVLSLHGNGECLQHYADAKLQLAAELGCSVIACDYREVGASAGMLLAASDMVADAALCVDYCERLVKGSAITPTATDGTGSASILILGQSMGGGVRWPWSRPRDSLATPATPLSPDLTEP